MIACTDCLVFDVVYYLLWWLLNLQLSRIPTTHIAAYSVRALF